MTPTAPAPRAAGGETSKRASSYPPIIAGKAGELS
jgi:hypothetical protein